MYLPTQLLLPILQNTTNELVQQFDLIDVERKETLLKLARYIREQVVAGKTVYLNFICTHNSRRSHISQLWAQAAAHAYAIENVHCLSGGTEATAFNPRAVKAMQHVGFQIQVTQTGDNPLYEVRFAEDAPTVIAFSKKYDDQFNNTTEFAAIMTCSHADVNCPIIPGATQRISITYNDPKEYDGSEHEEEKYLERVTQIGREMLFAFSRVKN
jgi:arsenate reductase (thioredoxin)